MLENRINEVIGKPYDETNFHCWDLVEYLVPNAPKIKGSAETLTKSVKHFKQELSTTTLEEVTNFENGDIIVLGNNGVYFHAGVYYNNGLVHANTNGTTYDTMKNIQIYYNLIKGLRV